MGTDWTEIIIGAMLGFLLAALVFTLTLGTAVDNRNAKIQNMQDSAIEAGVGEWTFNKDMEKRFVWIKPEVSH